MDREEEKEEEEGTGPRRTGREGGNDDKRMGGGLDGGVMCCFRANCFCDSGTDFFIAIGYNQELIEALENKAASQRVFKGGFSLVHLLRHDFVEEKRQIKKRDFDMSGSRRFAPDCAEIRSHGCI